MMCERVYARTCLYACHDNNVNSGGMKFLKRPLCPNEREKKGGERERKREREEKDGRLLDSPLQKKGELLFLSLYCIVTQFFFCLSGYEVLHNASLFGQAGIMATGFSYYRPTPVMETSHPVFTSNNICNGQSTHSHESLFKKYPNKPATSKDSAPLPPPSDLRKKKQAGKRAKQRQDTSAATVAAASIPGSRLGSRSQTESQTPLPTGEAQ